MKRSYLTQRNDAENYETREVHYSLRPSYFDDFHCLAQDCKMTCCTEWNITINRKDYLKLRKQKGSEQLMQAIKQSVRKIKNSQEEIKYAEIRCPRGEFCPMMTENGLCGVQVECGYQVLPEVCRSFPRKKEYTNAGYLEHSLTLGCEAVWELFWNLRDGIDFIEEELPKTEWKTLRIEKTSPSIYFGEIRLLCIDLLQDRRFTVAQRIMLLGFLLQKLPETSEGVPSWYVESKEFLDLPNIAEIAASLIPQDQESMKKCFLQNMKIGSEILMARTLVGSKQQGFLRQLLGDQEGEALHIIADMNTYLQAKQNLLDTFGDLEYFFENLAVSIFYLELFPSLSSKEDMWKSYVNFCNLYSLHRFAAIVSCKTIVPDQKEQMIKALVIMSRSTIHSDKMQKGIRDEFFYHESSSLAHMSILLSI